MRYSCLTIKHLLNKLFEKYEPFDVTNKIKRIYYKDVNLHDKYKKDILLRPINESHEMFPLDSVTYFRGEDIKEPEDIKNVEKLNEIYSKIRKVASVQSFQSVVAVEISNDPVQVIIDDISNIKENSKNIKKQVKNLLHIPSYFDEVKLLIHNKIKLLEDYIETVKKYSIKLQEFENFNDNSKIVNDLFAGSVEKQYENLLKPLRESIFETIAAAKISVLSEKNSVIMEYEDKKFSPILETILKPALNLFLVKIASKNLLP